MDTLPVEILFEIIDYLTPNEQIQLQLVSKHFLTLARDNTLWRLHCYEDSWANAGSSESTTDTSASLLANTTASLSSLGQTSLRSLIQPRRAAGEGGHGQSGFSLAQRTKAAADWDPSYEKEDIDWYWEYAARHGPVSFNWLQQPATRKGGNRKESREVKGMGLVRDWSFAGQDRVVAPLDDGSVCVWDLDHSLSAKGTGRMLGFSGPGILTDDPVLENSDALEFTNLGDCVSMDSRRRRVCMAVGNVLNEVDLETLQVVSRQQYPRHIFALSQETDYPAPLTVATTKYLHLYDPRLSISSNEGEASELFQPNPLSVLHPPASHENTIIIAGRFPSILHYDRRFFRQLQDVIYSGGGLCGLVSAPSPQFSSHPGSTGPDSQRVVACGEYKGRGSLELYNLTWSPNPSSTASNLSPAVYQNRQSAASSKLLSVASHGARLVYSDADGNVKWVERDGRTKVRRWNINVYHSDVKALGRSQKNRSSRYGQTTAEEDDSDTEGLFADSANPYGNNEVVQKVLPTGGDLTSDELLIWTGEQIGRLRFSGAVEPDCYEEEEDDLSGAQDLDSTTREEIRHRRRDQSRREREYERTMRKALERQADEVRRMGDLGMA